MEICDPEYADKFPSGIKIVGIGETGASASNYFGEIGNEIFPERLIISGKDDIDDSRTKILDFITGTFWLFAITDIENLKIAAQVAACVEESRTRTLITSLILCPTAQDARLADIPDSFGTWIILPKDKIAATGLTTDEVMYQVIDKITCIVSENCLIGLDFADVKATLENRGRACVGFAEENNSLAAVKKALKSPLFIEDIRQAKKCLLVFVGNLESFSMLEANEAANFLYERFNSDTEDFYVPWQVVHDDAANYSSMAFVLATDFEK